MDNTVDQILHMRLISALERVKAAGNEIHQLLRLRKSLPENREFPTFARMAEDFEAEWFPFIIWQLSQGAFASDYADIETIREHGVDETSTSDAKEIPF